MANLSSYASDLDKSDQERYKQKLTVTLNDSDVLLPDPYNKNLDGWFINPKTLPPTTYAQLYRYLIKTPGPFTGEDFDAYKSLDAYNYFISGHIKEIQQLDPGNDLPVLSSLKVWWMLVRDKAVLHITHGYFSIKRRAM